jgi:hypothetical protein
MEFGFVYMIIGLAYVIINGAFRKFYTDGDMFLPIIHFLLWPLFIGLLIVVSIVKWIKRKREVKST